MVVPSGGCSGDYTSLERRPWPELVPGQEAAALACVSANAQSLMWACFPENFCASHFPCAAFPAFPHSPLPIPGEGTVLAHK